MQEAPKGDTETAEGIEIFLQEGLWVELLPNLTIFVKKLLKNGDEVSIIGKN